MAENNADIPFKCCMTILLICLTFAVSIGTAFILLIDSYSCPKNNYRIYNTKLCTAIPNDTFDATPDYSNYTKLLPTSVIVFWLICFCFKEYREYIQTQNRQTQNI